jgi:LPS export ABC transporter protein LptC
MKYILGSIFIILLAGSCSNNELQEPLEYTGPLSEAEDVELYYSDKDQVQVRLNAALLYEHQSGDREFPKGIFIEFFDEFGKLESTLKADEAYFFKADNQWRGRGDVEVTNTQKNEQLNTEELFWKPGEKRIFTDKFVTIKQQGDVIYGEGLDAAEDLSSYTITKLSGRFEVNE